MFIERAVRDELNQLSKEVFNSPGRWKKILEQGYTETVMRTVKEEVPGENGAESTVVETKVPVLTAAGGKQSVVKYHSLESLKKQMLIFKSQRDVFFANLKAKQDADAASKAQAELERKVQEHIGGTAL